MPRIYKHPYKASPGALERPPMAPWLQGRTKAFMRSRPYRYWCSMYWATPPWLNESQIEQMKRIHASCPIGFEIDHRIPINHKYVCGLNVPWNLVAVPKEYNASKNNRCFIYEENFEQLELFEIILDMPKFLRRS